MTGQTTSERPDVAAWRVGTLRATVFTGLDVTVDDVSKWQDVVGEPPTKSNSQPRIGQLDETGPFGNGGLFLTIAPGRINWQYGPVLGDEIPEEIPNVGPLPEALDLFTLLVMRWSESSPPITRLAFGAQLVMPVGSHGEAYRLLDTYLPTVNVDPETSDFYYSINRKRPSNSGLPDLILNRLSKWGAIRAQTKVGSLKHGEVRAVSDAIYACKVELDINTTPEYEHELTRDRLPDLFQELTALGVEIATQGDIP